MNNNLKKNKVQYILILISILFIILGIRNGNIVDLYNKARFICLECIGIG